MKKLFTLGLMTLFLIVGCSDDSTSTNQQPNTSDDLWVYAHEPQSIGSMRYQLESATSMPQIPIITFGTGTTTYRLTGVDNLELVTIRNNGQPTIITIKFNEHVIQDFRLDPYSCYKITFEGGIPLPEKIDCE